MRDVKRWILGVMIVSVVSMGVVRELEAETKVVLIPLVETKATGDAIEEDVLEGVTFSSEKGEGLLGTMPNVGRQDIVPGGTAQGIMEGYHDGTGAVSGDGDLISGNIKHTVDIFGVAGTLIEASGSATDAQVLSGVTYSNATGASTGTMPNNGAGGTITPGTSDQTVAAGYWSSTNTVSGDAALAAGNIISGATIFGVSGSALVATGDATAGDVLTGKTFSNNGSAGLTGSMPNNGAVTITPGTANQAIAAGYHNGSGEVLGDAELTAENIKSGVEVFEVTGSHPLAGVAKTGAGQIIGYDLKIGEDGELQKGIAWPNPRFTDNGDGTVADNLTGLIWLKNADCPNAGRNWETALADVTQLNTNGTMNSNDCGDLSNSGSHQTDWRLPNRFELDSLVDLNRFGPSLPSGHPFENVVSSVYWSSSTWAVSSNNAWFVTMADGRSAGTLKLGTYFVWPVRAGN
jgi:Protein of unknown function (DUF1566)